MRYSQAFGDFGPPRACSCGEPGRKLAAGCSALLSPMSGRQRRPDMGESCFDRALRLAKDVSHRTSKLVGLVLAPCSKVLDGVARTVSAPCGRLKTVTVASAVVQPCLAGPRAGSKARVCRSGPRRPVRLRHRVIREPSNRWLRNPRSIQPRPHCQNGYRNH